MSKHILVFRRLRNFKLLFIDLPRYFIKQAWRMPFGLIFFGKGIAFSFYRYNMKQLWAWYIFKVLKRINEFGNVMAIYRTEITQVQRFKKVTAFGDNSFNTGFQLAGHFPGKFFSYR